MFGWEPLAHLFLDQSCVDLIMVQSCYKEAVLDSDGVEIGMFVVMCQGTSHSGVYLR